VSHVVPLLTKEGAGGGLKNIVAAVGVFTNCHPAWSLVKTPTTAKVARS